MPISSKNFILPPLLSLLPPTSFRSPSPSLCSSHAETLFFIFPLLVHMMHNLCFQKHREDIKRVSNIIFRNIKETMRTFKWSLICTLVCLIHNGTLFNLCKKKFQFFTTFCAKAVFIDTEN